MAKKDEKILTDAIQAVIMAIGREENAIEFYGFLSKNTPVLKAQEFFKAMEERETDDLNVMETFLLKLKKEEAEGD